MRTTTKDIAAVIGILITMIAVIILAVWLRSIPAAGTAGTDPMPSQLGSADQAFLAELEIQGVSFESKEAATAYGEAVCEHADGLLADTGLHAQRALSGITGNGIVAAQDAATLVYCPQYAY